MLICEKCGFENENDDIFCAQGGYKLDIQVPKISEEDSVIPDDLLISYKALENQIVELNDIDDQIIEVNQYYVNLIEEKKKLENKYFLIRNRTKKEFKDVEKLKSLTWTSIKARITGVRDQQQKIEELEYFKAIKLEEEAKFDFDEIKKRVFTAYDQLGELKDLKKEKYALKRSLVNLLDEVYQGESGSELENNLEKEIDSLEKDRSKPWREKSELKIPLGHLKTAKNHFSRGLEKLRSAKGFSDWDTFLGGGFLADTMKYNRISDARNAVQQGYYSLDRAYKSYKDLTQIRKPIVQEGNYFWDTFFDNIFSDYNARQRIKESSYSVENAIRQVRSVINDLEKISQKLDLEIDQLNDKIFSKKNELTGIRKRLIESYLKSKT